MVKTYGEVYRQIKTLLQQAEDMQPAETARELLAFAAGHTTAQIMGMQNDPVPESVSKSCFSAVGQILAGKPLAYILGNRGFYGFEFTVTQDVLIPRDDTMAVVDLALEQRGCMPARPRILDLCTGSGCIGLVLAKKMSDAKVTLVDVSEKALRIAKKNAVDLQLSGRTTCIAADVLRPADAFLGMFDMIVSNPPYITDEEMKTLEISVKDYEPHLALCGGNDGLKFYRAIVANFTAALKPGGFLCFEFGLGQERAVCEILKENDYIILELRKDLGGIVRAVLAQKKERYRSNGNG